MRNAVIVIFIKSYYFCIMTLNKDTPVLRTVELALVHCPKGVCNTGFHCIIGASLSYGDRVTDDCCLVSMAFRVKFN